MTDILPPARDFSDYAVTVDDAGLPNDLTLQRISAEESVSPDPVSGAAAMVGNGNYTYGIDVGLSFFAKTDSRHFLRRELLCEAWT